MQPTLTTYEGLQTWFFDNKRPFFTLYNGSYTKKIILRNETVDNIESAWELLSTHIKLLGGANLIVYVTDKSKGNVGNEVNVRISSLPTMAGIHGAPSAIGMVSKVEMEAEMNKKLAAEREKWEMQSRIEALEGAEYEKRDFWEKAIDRIGENPQLAGTLNTAIAGFFNLLTQKMGPTTVVAGTNPQAVQAEQPQQQQPTAKNDPEDEEFYKLLDEVTATLEVTDIDLMRKLHSLVHEQTALAKSFFG